MPQLYPRFNSCPFDDPLKVGSKVLRRIPVAVIAVEIFIATYYVEIAWLEFGMWALGIVAIIVGMRGCKSCESDKQ